MAARIVMVALAIAVIAIGIFVVATMRSRCEQSHLDRGASKAEAWAECKPPPGM